MQEKKKFSTTTIFIIILGALFVVSLLVNIVLISEIGTLNKKIDELQEPILGFLSGKLQIWEAQILNIDGKLNQQLVENPYKVERDEIMKKVTELKKKIDKIKRKRVKDWQEEYRNIVIEFNKLENMVKSYIEKADVLVK